jgi:hypothetical protein
MEIGIIESFLFVELFSFYFLMENLENNENDSRKYGVIIPRGAPLAKLNSIKLIIQHSFN